MTDFTATRPYTYASGTVINPDQNNPNETTLYGKFNDSHHATTGHTHSGATGDGTKIPLTTGITGTLPIANGGTAGITASAARTNLLLTNGQGWFHNLAIVRGTTSVAGDSVKITSADGTALSATNIGYITLNGTTAGQTVEFQVTADVTINLTGAHWGAGTLGDLTAALLRVLAINDNGTLRWGVALLGGRTTLLTTDTNATATNINLPEEVLCTAAVGSATNRCRELGYVRVDFDDTGGSSEDLWIIQSGIDDCVTGESCDGIYQPWKPFTSGFTSDPPGGTFYWTQHGRTGILQFNSTAAASDSTGFTATAPFKIRYTTSGTISDVTDNSASGATGVVRSTAGSQTMTMLRSSAAAWTAANNKAAVFNQAFEVGPAASFL